MLMCAICYPIAPVTAELEATAIPCGCGELEASLDRGSLRDRMQGADKWVVSMEELDKKHAGISGILVLIGLRCSRKRVRLVSGGLSSKRSVGVVDEPNVLKWDGCLVSVD